MWSNCRDFSPVCSPPPQSLVKATLTPVTLQALCSSAGFLETWAMVGAWISHFITKQHAPGPRPVWLYCCQKSTPLSIFLLRAMFFFCFFVSLMCTHSVHAALCRAPGLCLPLRFGLVVWVSILSERLSHKTQHWITSRLQVNKERFGTAVG